MYSKNSVAMILVIIVFVFRIKSSKHSSVIRATGVQLMVRNTLLLPATRPCITPVPLSADPLRCE